LHNSIIADFMLSAKMCTVNPLFSKIPIFHLLSSMGMSAKLCEMTIHERLAYARKKLHMTQAQLAEKICVKAGFLSSMEIGDRKINHRMIKIINLTTGISQKWLETGEGEMFDSEIEHEVEEIVNLYRQLNPFFKGFFKRQLLEIINYENESCVSAASENQAPAKIIETHGKI